MQKIQCQFICRVYPNIWERAIDNSTTNHQQIVSCYYRLERSWTLLNNAYTKLGPKEYQFNKLKFSFNFKRRDRFPCTIQPMTYEHADVKFPTTIISQMSNKLNEFLLHFISLLLFISSSCNFRLHLFLNMFLFCDRNYLKLGYCDKNKASPLFWKLRYLLPHIRCCYTAHVDHIGAVKPDLREIELLLRFSCCGCYSISYLNVLLILLTCSSFCSLSWRRIHCFYFLQGSLVTYIFSHTLLSSFRFRIKSWVPILSRLLYAEVSCACQVELEDLLKFHLNVRKCSPLS